MRAITDIYFIRHAESFGNLTRRAYGWYDGIITPKGYQQVKCLEERFRDVKVDVVYSSDLIRTCKTAEAIYKPKKIELRCDSGFREVSIGAWEDMPWGKIPENFPEAYENWVSNPLEFAVPGGETYAEVYLRAKESLLRAISENDGKTIAVVSHGATLRMLMYGIVNNDDLRGIENSHWGDNTCVSLFRYENGQFSEIFKNDNSHLSSMDDFEENMRWVSEGGGRNTWYELASFPKDRDRIRAYYDKAWLAVFGEEPSNYKDIDRKTKRLLARNSDNIAFAHCIGGEVGIIITDEDISLYPSAGHISLLYLNPEFRRKRYGIQLIGHAMSKYYNLGKKHLSVRVAEDNLAAQSFYKKYGFYEVFREIEYDTKQIVMLLDIK